MGKQVLDIEQMKHLQELGLDTSDASMCWVLINEKPYLSFYNKEYPSDDYKAIPTFTLQDILDILPKSTKYGQLQIRFCEYPNGTYGNEVVYDSMAHNGVTFFCENVIDSAYEMLCLCIKEGFVKTNK